MIPAPSLGLIEIIDPHVHLFALEQGQYSWLQPHNPPFWPDKHKIQRSFTAQDLALAAPFSLSGYVHIEAGFDNQQPWHELDHLAQQSPTPPFCAISCCDLTLSSEAFIQQITELSSRASLVGVRHILDEQAFELLTSAQVLTNLAYLSQQGLIFDAQFDLTDSRVVECVCGLFAASGPSLVIADPLAHTWVINHVGLGGMNEDSHAQWLHNMTRLALIPNIKVKASGWEMAQRDYSVKQITQTITLLLDIWGEERVMLASNFPLTLLSCTYQMYWQRMLDVLDKLAVSQTTKRALLAQNALVTYFISQ